MKYQEYLEFAAKMLKAGLPFLVEGEPGTGKTDLTTVAAEEMLGYDMFIMEPAYKSPIDFGGVPAQIRPAKGDKAAEWDYTPVGTLRHLINAKRPTVLMMDDFGQGTTATQNATSHLIHARRVGESELSDKVRVCAATNRAQDKAGVNPMLEHVKSRWTTIVHLEPDVKGWLQWARECDDVGLIHVEEPMPAVLPAFIEWKGKEMLFNFEPKPGLENSRSPRTVHHVGQLLASGAVTESNAFELISRATDKGFATEFLAFLKLWAHLPHPQDILDDPDLLDTLTFEKFVWDEKSSSVISIGQTSVSQRPDVAYSLVSKIAEIVSKGEMVDYVDLLKKFPKPVEVMGMLMLKYRREGHFETRAFNKWASENQRYMM